MARGSEQAACPENARNCCEHRVRRGIWDGPALLRGRIYTTLRDPDQSVRCLIPKALHGAGGGTACVSAPPSALHLSSRHSPGTKGSTWPRRQHAPPGALPFHGAPPRAPKQRRLRQAPPSAVPCSMLRSRRGPKETRGTPELSHGLLVLLTSTDTKEIQGNARGRLLWQGGEHEPSLQTKRGEKILLGVPRAPRAA